MKHAQCPSIVPRRGLFLAALMLAGLGGARPALAAKPVITHVATCQSFTCALDVTGQVW